MDYDIDVRLHPDSNVVRGSETVSYTNNSPGELEHLWLQLDQNLFDPSSEGAAIVKPGQRFSGVFPGGGYDISNVRLTVGGETFEPEVMIDGTVMRVTLPEPLRADGGEAELSLDFRFEIPSYGADRMGRLEVEQGTVFQLAQWYPRMFVYDDAHGWNVMPYLGQGEFYLEYGSFDVEVTVPRDFVVVGTGRLQNEERVLTETQRQRLEKARGSSETVHLIREDEVGDPSTRPSGDTTRVTLEQEGLVMPLRLRLEYADGSTDTRRIPVEAWHTSDRFTATIIGPDVRSVTVDPENRLPDVDRGNDGWSAAADGDSSR